VERDAVLPLTIDPGKIHFFALDDGRALRSELTGQPSPRSELLDENRVRGSRLPLGSAVARVHQLTLRDPPA
jgi:hypothetical protein